MLSNIINFGALTILSFLCNSLVGINDTNSDSLNLTNSDSSITSARANNTFNASNYLRRDISTSPRIDWSFITNNIFGSNKTVNNTSVFVTKEGLKKLMKKLGLTKKSGKIIQQNKTYIKCLTANEILAWYNSDNLSGLTEEQFKDVCPVLLLQIHYRICRPVAEEKPKAKDYIKIWLYSSGAVALCSLVGLAVVWLIPILPKSYYNSISQLLIALAVGSLTGDALLHLIPHALLDDGSGGHSHGKGSDKTHSQMVWKALAAFIGIHLFFLTERITILCQNLKSKRKLKNKQHSHENIYLEVPSGDTFEDPDKVVVKFSENKSSSTGKLHWASKSRKYSSSSRELEHASSHNGLNTDINIGAHLCNRPKNKPHVNSDCPDSMNIDLCHTINSFSMIEESAENQRSGNNVDNRAPVNGEIKSSNNQITSDIKTPENGSKLISIGNVQTDSLVSVHKDHNLSKKDNDKVMGHTSIDSNSNNVETKVVTSRQSETKMEIGAGGATVKSSLAHPHQNKPHGHHHGHSHDLSSVKAIAYTVIAGDGLHNFCDGIAIGAAFANDIRGGLSTAIAVLCHELPHELGDFVVLLHAGMSFRTAIFYNLLSSIFCAAGMIIGVLLGTIPSVSSWIFMLTAGMFLYIALVDMMPELSTRRLQGNKLFHRPSILFLWQNVGLILGAIIMLLIALYEENMF